MAARPSLDERFRRVRELRSEADFDKLRAALSKALADSSNLVVAEAAKIIAEMELSGFESELLRAWERFLVDPAKSDKGCAAKEAIVAALLRLDFDDADFYRAGMAYAQIEPGWPRSEDTAANVRGGCAFGLARSHQARTVTKLMLFVDLLNSRSRVDRVHAARAIADTGSESALPLLNLKLLSGDEHAEVLGACLTGLLRLDAAASLPLAAAMLDSRSEDIVIEAAAALGECGHDAAIDALIARAGRTRDGELLRVLCSSIGLSRSPKAVSYLVARVENNGADAPHALDALRPALVYAEIRERVREAVAKTGNRELARRFNALVP